MFLNVFSAVILASSLACAVTTLGIYIINRFARWGNRNVVYFMSFAAGILISVSFIHLVPKSFEMSLHGPVYLLLGFMGLYLINRFLNAFVCHQVELPQLASGIVPMLGIGFHSFLDGVIYSVTYNVSIFTGVLATIGMVLHELPEGIVTYLLLKRCGFDGKKSALYAFLAAGISTPLGTLISFPFIHEIHPSVLGTLLALSAGALVYVGASHLLPAVEKENKRYSLLALASGIFVAGAIIVFKGQ
ncbi:MAG TPA: ZIP family metal transporter [Anaerolineae bacterium]|nr:ZIP family metal transporter [Anaerolineae bacterium]